MGIKINVRKRIVVNGVEYDGPEALPADLRAAYDKAMAGRGTGAGTSVKVTFNGQAYDSVDHMPPDVRTLYDAAMRTLSEPSATPPSPGQDGIVRPLVDARPVVLGPTPTSPLRWVVVGVALVVGLVILYFLARAGGR